MGPGHDELSGGHGADAGQVQQRGADGRDEFFDVGLVFGGFGFEVQRPPGDCAEGADRGAVLDRVGGQCAQPGAAFQLLVGAAAAQLLA